MGGRGDARPGKAGRGDGTDRLSLSPPRARRSFLGPAGVARVRRRRLDDARGPASGCGRRRNRSRIPGEGRVRAISLCGASPSATGERSVSTRRCLLRQGCRRRRFPLAEGLGHRTHRNLGDPSRPSPGHRHGDHRSARRRRVDLGLSTVFLSAASDAASAIYQRLGFRRIATACVAEAP